jgi:hypothetical protein
MSFEHGAQPPYGFGWQPAPPVPEKRGHSLAVAVGAAAAMSAVSLVVSIVALVRPAPSLSSAAAPTSSVAPTPQFNPGEVSAAKDHLCRTFDMSVRGQEGQGGLREQSNLNLPLTLRSVNSALAVQVALVPAVTSDVANAARTYVAAELEATTAVMGNTPATDVNRLVNISNDAVNKLLDVCGLPR